MITIILLLILALIGSIFFTFLMADLLCLGGRAKFVGMMILFMTLLSTCSFSFWLAGYAYFSFFEMVLVAVVETLILSPFILRTSILRRVYRLFSDIRVICLQVKYTGLPTRGPLLAWRLYVDFVELFLQDRQGVFCFNNLTITSPSRTQLNFLIKEIFIKQEYLVAGLGDKPFIIDCGANIGIATLFFKSLYPNASILCFEPDDISVKYLNKNVERNKLSNIVVEPKALSDSEGSVIFSGGGTTGSSVHIQDKNERTSVSCVQLSRYIDRTIDLLKIDVEGAESKIFMDLEKSGKFKLIKNIIFEYHYTHTNQNHLGEVLVMLERHNFSVEIRTTGSFCQGTEAGKLLLLLIFATARSYEKITS